MTPRWRCATRRLSPLAVVALVATLAALAGPQPAFAQTGCESLSGAACKPYWRLASRSAPTNLPLAGEQLVGDNDEGLKGEGMIIATATNLGDAGANGEKSAITLVDQLPKALKPVDKQRCGKAHTLCSAVALTGPGVRGGHGQNVEGSCAQPAQDKEGWLVQCTVERELPPYEHVEVLISVESTATETQEPVNTVTVTGGGAGEAKIEPKLKIARAALAGASSTRFGVEQYEFEPENEHGEPDATAGSHPFQLTTTFNLNQTYGLSKENGAVSPQSPALQKDLSFELPAGMLGNPDAVPQCPDVAFGAIENNGINACPDNTAIGVANVSFVEPINFGHVTWAVPVFNLVPAPGEPAKFGFAIDHVPVVLDTSLRTGEDYGVTVRVHNTSAAVQVLGAQVTLWGTPGDPAHDESRGWNCLGNRHWVELFEPQPVCGTNEFTQPQPFLILPTSPCAPPLPAAPLSAEVTGDSWGGETLRATNEGPVSLTACQNLPFSPSLGVTPDVSSASSPSGMTVDVNMPQQETTMSPTHVGEADIKETTLALPPGVQASAGAANGLAACGTGESGLLGAEESPFAESFEQHFTPATASCPDAAKIGSVKVQTPLLPHPLTGGLYLGEQHTNAFRPPLVLYLIASEEDPIHHEGSKVLIKLAGEVKICAQVAGACREVGQLISTFRHTPQAPFEHLEIHLFGGARAAQATPPRCESYDTKATLVPWSEGVASKKLSSSFQISTGPPLHAGGFAACPAAGPLPFAPAASAGPTNTQAGAFTEFTLTLERPDGERPLTGLSVYLPQGAAAMLASVTPCPIAQADAGTCTESSEIGTSQSSSGLGATPLTLPGRVYLTERLAGAPFGISVDTPANLLEVGPGRERVGPFNIGTIIANSTIQVDPNTAAATITAVQALLREPDGSLVSLDAPLPTVIKGVPVQLKTVRVSVNRHNFEFNPTNCTGRSDTGAPIATNDTLTGPEGGSATQSTPYPVTGCGSLAFSPKFTASVAGQGSKANGTTFTVKVESTSGQANIAKTFLALPIALPSRLSTIQQACVAATFERNPASCDEGSNIGYATARTPVLRQPLRGPAYLVSHGNAAFPDVEFVLQSEGVEIVLDGKTDIKKGITYSRFEALPDAPVETFETVLPAGPHSALTANVPEREHFNLCKQKLVIPTEITGQNGALLKQQTKVAITGCSGVAAFCATRAGTKACELKRALQACRKKYRHNRRRRATCEASARKRYASKTEAGHQRHRRNH
jgi:hypothetical protein